MHWIDRINNESNIASFIDETFLNEHIPVEDTSELNWMRIFNSDIQLTNCFIVRYIQKINWVWMMRPIAESILDRYNKSVVQWNAQLYGQARTIEFLMRYQDKFNWLELSRNLPKWFNEYHIEIFEDKLNWKLITSRVMHLHPSILMMHIGELNWKWISIYNIPNEAFALRFINYIKWDEPQLHIANLSTEFLYDIRDTRQIAYDLSGVDKRQAPLHKSTTCINNLNIHHLTNTFDPSCNIQIGATITFKFFKEHYHEIDLDELKKRNLLTEEMVQFIEIQTETDSTGSTISIDYDAQDVMVACI
jgi:hypothetical protein